MGLVTAGVCPSLLPRWVPTVAAPGTPLARGAGSASSHCVFSLAVSPARKGCHYTPLRADEETEVPKDKILPSGDW